MYNVSYRVVLGILVPQTLKYHMHTAESWILISVSIFHTYNMLLFNHNNESVLQLLHTWIHTTLNQTEKYKLRMKYLYFFEWLQVKAHLLKSNSVIHTEKTSRAKNIVKENRNHFMNCFWPWNKLIANIK